MIGFMSFLIILRIQRIYDLACLILVVIKMFILNFSVSAIALTYADSRSLLFLEHDVIATSIMIIIKKNGSDFFLIFLLLHINICIYNSERQVKTLTLFMFRIQRLIL